MQVVLGYALGLSFQEFIKLLYRFVSIMSSSILFPTNEYATSSKVTLTSSSHQKKYKSSPCPSSHRQKTHSRTLSLRGYPRKCLMYQEYHIALPQYAPSAQANTLLRLRESAGRRFRQPNHHSGGAVDSASHKNRLTLWGRSVADLWGLLGVPQQLALACQRGSWGSALSYNEGASW